MESITEQVINAMYDMEQSEVVALVAEELIQHVPDDVLREIMTRIVTQ